MSKKGRFSMWIAIFVYYLSGIKEKGMRLIGQCNSWTRYGQISIASSRNEK